MFMCCMYEIISLMYHTQILIHFKSNHTEEQENVIHRGKKNPELLTDIRIIIHGLKITLNINLEGIFIK
jgi:hypothetical protein